MLVAVGNQLMTLDAIASEIDRQKRKMASDYATISERFETVFQSLDRRIRWHRRGMWAICFIALLGAGFATFAYSRLVDVSPWACVATSTASIEAATPATSAAPPVAGGPRHLAAPGVGADARRTVADPHPIRRDE